MVLPPPGGAPEAIDFSRDPLIGFATLPIPAQPFLAALGLAVAAHPQVRAAIAATAAASGVRTQVRAGLFPQLDLQFTGANALARRFSNGTTVVESLQPTRRADAGITGNQLLFDFGATGSRIAAANERVAAAKAEVARAATDIALRAVAAWFDVLVFQALADVSAASAARQREILADVRMRVAQGIGAASDTARGEAVLASTEAQAGRYQRLLGQAHDRYQEAFGVAAPAHLDRIATPPSTALSHDAAEAMARKSPVAAAARRRAEAANRDWRAARSDRLPRLAAGVDATRYDVFNGSDYELRATLTLRQSLFAGGRQRGVIDEAGARWREVALAADQVEGESGRDAGIAFGDVAALTATADTLQRGYVASRRVRDAYVEQFRVSRGTLIELLRAEQDYVAAAETYLQGVVELDVARFTLLGRTGEILDVAGITLSTDDR
jgi:adhesin transport system outer membrane protein